MNAINLKSGNRSASRDVNFYKAFFQGFKPSGNRMKLYTVNKGTGERLSRAFLNLCMFSEVICKRFTEDTYLPRVMCTVFGFAR